VDWEGGGEVRGRGAGKGRDTGPRMRQGRDGRKGGWWKGIGLREVAGTGRIDEKGRGRKQGGVDHLQD
jgi:hypothetical protein